jgi:uncharacterized membrane protein
VLVQKKKFILFFIMLFVITAFTLAMPVMAFAQEEEAGTGEDEEIVEPAPEKITVDIDYQEINSAGIIGIGFQFQMDITYDGKEAKLFEFVKDSPGGWSIEITPLALNTDITRVKLAPLEKESFKVTARPLILQEPGEYDINITIRPIEDGGTPEAEANFTAIVKPAGKLKLRTDTGIFSTIIRSGRDNNYKLILENTGSAPVEEITISTKDEPEGWQVDFEKEIDIIEVGEEKELDINIVPSEKTIAGDYMVRFITTSGESTDYVDLRLMVVTPMIWRIVGIALIVVVVVGIAVIFARLGRR